jgi:hypothetical protein
MSKHKGALTAAWCGLSRETKRHNRVHAEQSGCGCDLSVYVNRRGTSMKGRVRQVHFRQHKDQHDKEQQSHQNE